MYPPPQHKKLKAVVHSIPAVQHVHTELVEAEPFGTRTTQTPDIQAMATEITQVVAHMDRTTGQTVAGVALAAIAAGEASGHKAISTSNTNEDKC